MATFDAPITSWTAADVQHFARRAGFGLTPEAATALAAQAPGPAIDAWIEGRADAALFSAQFARADVVSTGANGNIPADPAPHPFRTEGWRRQGGIPNAQALWAWRMQHNPNAFQEKLALFFHQLWATGAEKVDNPTLSLKQIDLFRAMGLAPFGQHLLAVSQDPAMMIWLDSVLNRVRPNVNPPDAPNENYAREIMELYSLGVDNGYSQADITNLAKAFSGWNLVPLDIHEDPNNANVRSPNDALFRIFRGQANTNPVDPRFGASLPNYHATGTVHYLDKDYDIGSATNYGQDLVGAILSSRGANCAEFIATRLLRFFVDPAVPAATLADLKALIQALDFDFGKILKALFKSQYFFAPQNRFNLYEGPVAWIVRGSRMLCPPLAAAAAATPLPAYPAWRAVVPYFDDAGQALLNPAGPNGWKEHEGWINSNTLRFRGKLAAALALRESSGNQMIFPTAWTSWFPTPPASAVEVFNRLSALLQPAPIPASVRDGWLSALWSSFTWDTGSGTEQKVRELAFLILCSPYAQLH